MLREIKFYKGRTILDITEKDALYCIKSPTETAFKLYVTDIDGNIVSLASVSSTVPLTSSDNSISITGTAVKDLKISSSLKTLILNSLQPGSNISELNNDSGYITITDLPIFNPSDYDLEDFNNLSADPFVRQSELTGGNTNLGYTPASNQGTITSDTGNDAIIPLATNTEAGLFSPTEKFKLAGIEDGAEVNNISDTDANDLTDGNETTLHHHDSRYYTETESDNKFVPYTGANQDVDLGEYQLKAGQIELDQTPTGTFGVGKIRWNDSAGTAEIRLKGNNVTLQIGQELVKRVVNKTATNINLLEANYQVVKIVGATGQRLSVDLAQADNALNSGTTIGVVTENIANNQEGFITYSGEINLVNTTGSLQGETWLDGDILYLSPTTPGALTKVKPTAPNHSVVVGYIEYAHATHGKIFVKIDNGYEISDLHDVNTALSKTTPVDTDSLLLQDSAGNNIWKKVSWSNVKATLKTYFDTIYTTTSAVATQITTALASFKTANFLDATSSIQTQINSKEPTITAGTTGQYYRGDKTFQTLNVAAVSGLQTELNKKDVLPVLYEKHANVPVFGSAALNNLEGVSLLASSVARSFADTNAYTRRQRVGLTTTTTGNAAQARQTITYFNRNSNLNIIIGVGFAENCTNPNVRAFAGVSTTTLFGNVEPTTLLNCIGLAKLTTSNNLHLIHNDGSGTATAIDLGVNFPSNTVETDFYTLELTTNGSNVDYIVTRVNTGNTASGTLTTDLPSVSTALNIGLYVVQNTGANTTTGIDFFGNNIIKW